MRNLTDEQEDRLGDLLYHEGIRRASETDDGITFREAAALVLTGDTEGDPQISPCILRIAEGWIESMMDSEARTESAADFIPDVLGTAGSQDLEIRRELHALDWMIRTALPLLLQLENDPVRKDKALVLDGMRYLGDVLRVGPSSHIESLNRLLGDTKAVAESSLKKAQEATKDNAELRREAENLLAMSPPPFVGIKLAVAPDGRGPLEQAQGIAKNLLANHLLNVLGEVNDKVDLILPNLYDSLNLGNLLGILCGMSEVKPGKPPEEPKPAPKVFDTQTGGVIATESEEPSSRTADDFAAIAKARAAIKKDEA
jgi:hypothetical protein